MNLVDAQDTDPCIYIRGSYPYTVIGSRVCKPCNVLNKLQKVCTCLVCSKAALPLLTYDNEYEYT